jgi:hypothetical protein
MKSDLIEERLRGALATHAESFSASPDAWQRIEEKGTARAGLRLRRNGTGWLARHSSFVIPAAAAAAVVAVALGAVALPHGLSGTGSSADHGAKARSSTGKVWRIPRQLPGPPDQLIVSDPPTGAIINLKVTSSITTYAWIGQPSPRYWFPYITTVAEFCHEVDGPHGGEGYCWPVSALNVTPAHPAYVVDNNANAGPGPMDPGSPTITGVARPNVTSVTAVLPDGRRFHAVISTGLGNSPDKAWSVALPAEKGTKLIFTGAAGQILTEISTAAPPGPSVLNLPRPAHGGVTVFHYPSSGTLQGGIVYGYLVDGYVAFFTSETTEALPFGGAISPHPAAGHPTAPPAIEGLVAPFRLACTSVCHETSITAFGYAHADVAKVVIRLLRGGQVATDTFRAGWPGSDLRLWQVTLPDSVWPADGSQPKLTATAYDATGHSLEQIQLGQPGS